MLPEARTAGAAAYDGKRIVFAGGAPEQPGTTDVWALTSQEWTPIGKLQEDRDQLAAATNGRGTVWFIGGGNGHSLKAYPLVDILVRGRAPKAGPPLAEGVRRAAAVGVGSGFCAIGGHAQGSGAEKASGFETGFTGQVQCQGTARSIPALEPPRASLGATVLGNILYVVGGYDAHHVFGTTTVEALDIKGVK